MKVVHKLVNPAISFVLVHPPNKILLSRAVSSDLPLLVDYSPFHFHFKDNLDE